MNPKSIETETEQEHQKFQQNPIIFKNNTKTRDTHQSEQKHDRPRNEDESCFRRIENIK